jgi:hypothetical protein
MYTAFWWRNLKEREHLKDLGLDGRIILYLKETELRGGEGVEWIDLAQDTAKWRDFVNTVVNLLVSRRRLS